MKLDKALLNVIKIYKSLWRGLLKSGAANESLFASPWNFIEIVEKSYSHCRFLLKFVSIYCNL